MPNHSDMSFHTIKKEGEREKNQSQKITSISEDMKKLETVQLTGMLNDKVSLENIVRFHIKFHKKNKNRTDKKVQMVKALATQAWGSEFGPWSPQKGEKREPTYGIVLCLHTCTVTLPSHTHSK